MGSEDVSHAAPLLAPAARRAGRLGLLGGSFDPPHNGHLHMARVSRVARDLDHVVWIPAARPPHKPDRILTSRAARLEMLELLLAGESDTSIWTGELERAGPSFTIDTVREVVSQRTADRGDQPDTTDPKLFFILGSDNLSGLPAWREVDELLRTAEPIVVPRADAKVDPIELERLSPELRERIASGVLRSERVDVSSSEIRAQLERGAEVPDAMPAALRAYIGEREIYARAP